MEKKKRVVKCVIDDAGNLGITAMGLVDFPAIEENWIALNKLKLSAEDSARKMLYGPALIPDKEILRLDKNGNEYYVLFEQETIRTIAQQLFKKNLHHNNNLMHEIPVHGVTVVESWIKEGDSDKSIQLGLPKELPIGTWFIGVKVDNDEVWNEVKAGTIMGFSIEGMFREIGVELSGVKSNEENALLEIELAINSYLVSLSSQR